MSKHTTTTDHTTIRRWVEERRGHPAVVTGTDGAGEDVLRIDLPGFTEQEFLEPIGWDRFFELFERKGLAFAYDDEGRFFALVARDPR
jgi:hypothetical protein